MTAETNTDTQTTEPEARSLVGRRTIVTGGSRGIGRAIAERLSERGARVALFDIGECEPLATGNSVSVQVDVADFAAVRRSVETAAQQLDGLDSLVNCAGIRRLTPIADITEAEWRSQIDINLTGAFACTQAVLPYMLENGQGAFVNISSTASLHSTSDRAAYSASKAGLEGLTRAIAVEMGRHKIRANAVCPGAIETALTAHYYADPEATKRLVSHIPAGTWAHPADVAGVVAFLLHKDSWYVNGVSLPVDGGWSASKDFERPEDS